MKLSDFLRMQCELMYHLHMTLSDIEVCDVSELKWVYGWLIKQKQDEQKAIEESIRNAANGSTR